MGRLKGSKNKENMVTVSTSSMSSADRIKFLANLIIDRIIYDQSNGKVLFKEITRSV